nr:non-ribosomal peptide synthetase [Bacteriovorax sp. HI3]
MNKNTLLHIHEGLNLLWKKVLQLDSLENDQNFFALGGHSLMAIDLLSDIEETFGIKLNMKDLVEAPTIKQLAIVILDKQKTATVVNVSEYKERGLYPLTLNQKQVWGLNVLYPDSITHNISTAIRIKRPLDIKILNDAINLIVQRQESLRTRFKVEQGVTFQEVIPEYIFHFDFFDIKESELKEDIQKEMKHVFNLTEAPLMKVKFYRLGPSDFVFFFLVHHIVWDGLSNTYFFHEFIESYEALEKGLRPALPSLGMSYKEHAVRELAMMEMADFQEQKASWKNLLEGSLPVLNLETDYPRPEKIDNRSGTLYFELSTRLLEKLEDYVQKKHISLYNVFFAVYNVLLAKLSGDCELIVGTPVHGRLHRESRKTFGYFINTLPIRTKLDAQKSFKDNLGLTLESLKQAFYNQSVPLDVILKTAKIENDPGRTPLFQTLFIYLDVTKELDVFKEKQLSQVKVERYSVHTEVDFYLYKSREKVEGVIEYRKDLYKEETMARMAREFTDLLEKIVADESLLLKELGVKSPEDSRQYIELDQRVYDSFSGRVPFYQLFEEHARTTPSRPALKTQYTSMTYGELDQRANHLALKLKREGVKKGDFVGVSTQRNEKMLVSLLAVLKNGAAYVPLDPGFPDERLSYMMERSGIKALVTEKILLDRFSCAQNTLIYEDIFKESFEESEFYSENVDLESTCYILFTSGSTGKPKGVEVTHKNVLNFLLSMKKEPGLHEDDKLLSVTTFSFDISVLELFLPLISEASVYIGNEMEVVNGELLAQVIRQEEITCMQATPMTWRLLLASEWKGSRKLKVLCGGEAMPRDLALKLLPKIKELWNMYGPTETTVWSTVKKISAQERKILVGRPIDNTCLYILNEQGEPCPVGVEGELFIGGLGVAKGYIKDLEQTQKRFVANPFRPDELMYNTGDMARFEPNGEVECLGRSDDQVKIRGFRIELGEIETRVMDMSCIHECAVKVHNQKIVVYAVASDEYDENAMKKHLKNSLPHYMVPAKIILLPDLPKTMNGKIDKKQLNESLGQTVVKEELSTSSHIIEEIRNIWSQVLGHEDIDIDENFFNLGGHSLSAIEIFGAINEKFNLNLPLASLFESTNIRTLSEIVEEGIRKKNQDLANLKCVVTIKPAESHCEAVFCFHGVGGNVLNYYRLADCVGSRAFYGIQARGVNGEDDIVESIPEMARIYIEEIKKIQPKGPYILAGGSMGGMIALEAAIQLKRQGEEIKSLLMFDTIGPNVDFKTYGNVKVNLLKRTKNSMIFKFHKTINYMKVKFYLFTKASIPHSVRYFSIEAKNYVALRSYTPQIFEGNITLIRAPKAHQGWYADPYLGWRSVINGKIDTIEIEGAHENFIESPSMSHALKMVMKRL